MLLLGFLYLLAGVITMIAYRWDTPDLVDGKELLLDVIFFPFVIWYWARSRGGR